MNELAVVAAAHAIRYCGGGNPEMIAEDFRWYLSAVREYRTSDGDWDHAARLINERFGDERHRHYVEYEADRVELTEHGGSVAGAWITDNGSLWLDLLLAGVSSDWTAPPSPSR